MVIIYSKGLYRTKSSVEFYNVLYTPPSPWSKEIPLDDCKIYTFIGSQWAPAKISYLSLPSCHEGENCSVSKGTCVDPDQIMARKYVHTCESLEGTSNKCLTQNGLEVDRNYIEEYYSPCILDTKDPYVPVCKGELSLLAFNTNIKTTGPNVLSSSVCLSIPTLTQEECSMATSLRGFPTQLLRIERADFTGTKFVENPSGQYVRIVNRSDGTVLAPDNSSLKWIKPGTLYSSLGYWWVFLSLQPSQIIYVDDPINFPSVSNPDEVMTYLNENNVYSIQPSIRGNSLPIGDKLTMGPLIREKNNLYQTQYFNYAILPLLLSSPQNYDFYGPFP
jgi:hypothetical protein